MYLRYSLLLSILFLTYYRACAQTDSIATEPTINKFILPIVYYTPETTWSFGGLGLLTFPLDTTDSPRSQLSIGAAYTLQNQLLLYLPFQLYWKADRLRLSGEVGYYRYNYFYYGVGNTYEDYEGETYGVNYPRVRINALKRIGERQLAGLRYAWDNWDVYDQEIGGLLLEQEGVVGKDASVYSALGPLWQRDSRDDVFFPSEGSWLEANVLASTEILGASQNFVKWTADARKYWSKKTNHIWAGQLYLEGNSGNPPFNLLAFLGGARILRGYYEGRFRDRQLAVAQLEYRFPIYKRFGGVAFAGMGSVADRWSNWRADYLRYTLGAGLRFNLLPEDNIRIRFDVGAGPGAFAFYFTVGESF